MFELRAFDSDRGFEQTVHARCPFASFRTNEPARGGVTVDTGYLTGRGKPYKCWTGFGTIRAGFLARFVTRIQRNHIACAFLVWIHLNKVARQTGETIYQIKRKLLDNYMLQELRSPAIRMAFA